MPNPAATMGSSAAAKATANITSDLMTPAGMPFTTPPTLTSANSDDHAAAAAAATTMVKRRRGRPRKNSNIVSHDGIERGGSTGVLQDVQQQQNDGALPKRKRGRPKKEQRSGQDLPRKKILTDATQTQSTISGDADGEPKKRGRGRPKKIDKESSPVSTALYHPPIDDTFPSLNALGVYRLQCAEVREHRPDGRRSTGDNMTLSIMTVDDAENIDTIHHQAQNDETFKRKAFIGHFNLGVVEGTMLLAATHDNLFSFRNQLSSGHSSLISYESRNFNFQPQPSNYKEPTATVTTVPYPTSLVPTPDSIPTNTETTTSPTHHRIYFRWRGRDTPSGRLLTDTYEADNTGYIDFNDSFTAFCGRIKDLPATCTQCDFVGVKVNGEHEDGGGGDGGDAPVKKQSQWNDLVEPGTLASNSRLVV